MLKSALKKRSSIGSGQLQKHHHQPIEPPRVNDYDAAAASSTEDFGILQLGSSVTVNEDARRIILTEIQDMEHSMTATQHQVVKEDKTVTELAQRRARTEWEVAGLREESHELLEQMTMNSTILAGLDSTLRTQIIPPDQDDMVEDMVVGGNDDDNAERMKESDESTPPPPTPVYSAADFRYQLQEVLAEADWMEREHRDGSDAIQEIMQHKYDTVQAMGRILENVQSEQLKVQLANAVIHKEMAESTRKEEESRLRALEQQVQQVNERCAVLESESDEMAAGLEIQKKEDADKIAAHQKLMTEQEEELRRLEEELAAIEKENMLMDQQIEQVTTNVKTATELLQQRQQQTTVLQETRAYRKTLFAEYVEKEHLIASTKENLEDKQRALHKVKHEVDELAKLKAENDATDIDELIVHIDQNRAAAASLEAALTKFANGNAEDDNGEDVKSTTTLLLDEAAARLEATDQELAEETKIHDDKVKELEQCQKSLDAHRASHHTALKIIQDEVAEHKEAEQALQQRLDESHQVAAEALEWGRTLKIFRSAKELHEKMDEKERQARELAGDNE